ncbi:helix-turn-helix transcriptional regulator [Aliiglaciecola sp. CAU 1673]|uniref:helix-turn-helix domain-containing protein n=1 Tax=Aliiglaciecola sp. CAU 1673 TaxID=3032595 RepID=UPI0023DB9774|nr:helix-turn-helix transcriptional regulator [Aliiglaciecola sp. CAU 1673]MDF2179371.1 helix-turn-helix transcriptional regulator [Aliiglaciecola sp. CAU 1673]
MLLTTIASAGVAIGLLLVFLLLTLKNGRQYGNRLLAGFVLVVCLSLATTFLQDQPQLYWLYALHIPWLFTLGPLLFWYVRWITCDDKIQPSWLWHFLPLLLAAANCFPVYFSALSGQMLSGHNAMLFIPEPRIFNLLYLQILVYGMLSTRLINQYRKSLKNRFCDIQHIQLRWLNALTLGLMALLVLDAVLGSWAQWMGAGWLMMHNSMITALVVYVICMAYGALKQPILLHGEPINKTDVTKYQKSGLREDSARYYLQKLQKTMQDEQLYLDSELTLKSLAGKLKMSEHHLSQILNDHLGMTFYDYINQHRIEHAKSLLADPEIAVTDICFAVGYNNKVTFYNAFKKRTRLTPSAWRKQLVSSQSHESHLKSMK